MPRPPLANLVGRRALRALLAIAALCLACSGDGPSSPRPGDVLLITVDTLRADHMGIYGYHRPTTPSLDRFFSDGLVVERAYSTEGNTSPSVASILSGLLPQEHGVRLLYQLLPEDIELIPDLLPESYQTAGFIANTVLTDEAMGLARHFDHYDDFIDEDVGPGNFLLYERNARRTTDAALLWLRTERDTRRPLFLWIHYIDPHSPYRSPEPAAEPFTHEGMFQSRHRGSPEPYAKPGSMTGSRMWIVTTKRSATPTRRSHVCSKGYAELASLEEALVVFTADHGESMLDHDFYFSHGHHVWDEVVRVPFLLKGPGIQPGRLARLGSGIDVAPTVLAFADTPIPQAMSGVDLGKPADVPADRRVYAESTALMAMLFNKDTPIGFWRAVIEGDRKWMAGMIRGDRQIIEERVYDLRTDPGELDPDPSPSPADARDALHTLIQQDPDPGGLPEHLRKGMRLKAPKVAPGVTPEQQRKLKALGYIE